MPIRVLDRNGEGNANDIADGIRFAVNKRAKLINLSLEFDSGVRASEIPQLLSAINYARSRGVLVVGAAGNQGETTISHPAKAPGVMSVGATTEGGCRSTSVFGIPKDYEGTSMAAPHVTAAAALVIATGVIGSNPSADRLESRLESTARDLGQTGSDRFYGAGLLNAAAATSR